MCIFSHDVQQVSNTKIYARLNGDRDVAMILPLPTQLPSTDQVSFVNLSGYDGFFRDMDRCFPQPLEMRSKGVAVARASPRNLMVHRVGAFDASFVPALADFHRLDLRFRLPEDVWKQLPLYSDFGFAVFQLRSGDMRIHPMALSFRTRNSTALFFPTAHVHDGSVHPVDVAMILPLPTQLPSTDQVSFVNLSGYDGFFHDMDRFLNGCTGQSCLATL